MEFNYPIVISFLVLFLAALYLLKKPHTDGLGSGFKNINFKSTKYTTDLTQLATLGKLDPVVGRDFEITKVIQVLSRRRKNNIILFGKAGIGKTAIVEGLAIAIANKKVPWSLQDKIVLKLDITSILAGTKYRGEFEKRFKELIDAIIATNKKYIVFIDEIHTIVQAGGAEGAIDADDIIKSPLARGELQMVGTTTTEEYRKFIEPDKTLTRRFEGYLVKEPSKKVARQMLEALKKSYEEYHHVRFSHEIIGQIVDHADKIKNKVFPDKAIDLMDELAAKVRLENMDNRKVIEITKKDLQKMITSSK